MVSSMEKGSTFILNLSIFSVMLGLGFIAPLLPIYATSLGASGFEVGVIFAAFAVVRAATMIPFGSLSDIFGRKFFIVLGMGVYVLASIIYILSRTILQLIFCRILHGIASALVVPAAMAYVADVSPEDRRGEAMGLFNTALFAGIGLGPLLGGILADKLSFHAPFYMCAFLASIGLVLDTFKLRESRKQGFSGVIGDTKIIKISYGFYLLRDKNMLSIVFSRIVTSVGFSALLAFFPLIGFKLGLGMSEVGLLLTVQALALIIFQKKFGKLSDKYGRKNLMVLGSIIGGVSLTLLTFTKNFLDFLIILVFFGLAGGITAPAYSAAIADLSGRERFGEAMGLFLTAMSIGMALGPIMGGIIADFTSLVNIFYVTALLTFIGAFILIFMFKETVKPKP